MSDGLKLISRHVNSVLAKQTRPLMLEVDDAWNLLRSRGDGRRYGLGELQEGASMEQSLAFLATADPDDKTPQAWRFVQLPGARICHVHVLRLERGWALALLDAEKDHAEQQARQQAAHELELLEEERERLIQELEQANRLKSDFIARMSHEFRTPLTSVIGYSDQLREIGGGDPQTGHHLQAIGRGARYLLNLVENLLDQARIEIDQLTLNPNGCDLHDMSDEVEQLLRPVAQQKQLSLAWWFDAEIPPRLWLDSTRLKQVMINLVGNAIKFTQQGGVSVEFGWNDGRLQVSVSDTGPGIAKMDLATIFEPFRQGQDGARAKGAGLGLSISQTLVRAMGGEITVSSEPGTGSRFEFSIRAEAVKGGRPSDTNVLRGKTVLVADDDADLLELLRLYLNSAGLHVKTCTDAAAALETMHNTALDVALLDLHLASDDGVALAQGMREAGFDKPIVLLSASPPGDVANAEKPDVFDARWLKPISRARLIEGLAELLT